MFNKICSKTLSVIQDAKQKIAKNENFEFSAPVYVVAGVIGAAQGYLIMTGLSDAIGVGNASSLAASSCTLAGLAVVLGASTLKEKIKKNIFEEDRKKAFAGGPDKGFD